MMNKQNIPDTWNWTCRCGGTYPLRCRKCSQCLEAMPQSVRTEVYRAELSFQKNLYRNITFKRSVRRMEKLDKFLSTTLVLMVIAAVPLTGYVCYNICRTTGQIELMEHFDIVMLRLEAVCEKVTAMDLDISPLSDKPQFVPPRLAGMCEKILIASERLIDLSERLEVMPQWIGDATTDSVDQIANLVKHIWERIGTAVEYVRALINEIQ